MSMRYADISSPTGASIPAVPTIPIALRQEPSKASDDISIVLEAKKEDTRETDLKMLDAERFDPDACELRFVMSYRITSSPTRRGSPKGQDGKFHGS